MKEVNFLELVPQVEELIRKGKAVIVAKGNDKKANIMTIGWGGLGTMWAKKVVFLFVRQSRYTHTLMEQDPYITLSLTRDNVNNSLGYCGTKSGRDVDKFQECNLTEGQGLLGKSSVIEEYDINLELKILYQNDMLPAYYLEKGLLDEFYENKDMHTFYCCEVLKASVKE